MSYRIVPQLVTIEGECDSFLGGNPYEIAELLGIDVADANILATRNLTHRDVAYLNRKYPEYMGIWPWLATAGKAIVTAIPKAVKFVAEKVTGKKKTTSEPAKRVGTLTAKEAALKKVVSISKRALTSQAEKQEVAKAQMASMAVPAIAIGIAALLYLTKR